MADLSSYLAQIENRLKAKTIHELRQIARVVGVERPADGQKGRVLSDTIAIATGRMDPCEPTKRGAPPKSKEYDRLLVADIMKCRELYLSNGETQEDFKLSVASGADDSAETATVYGILDRENKDWLVRSNGGAGADVHLNETFVTAYDLRVGDYLYCETRKDTSDDMAGVVNVLEVNGMQPSELSSRHEYSALTPVAVNRRLTASLGTAGRIIDLIAPIGVGGRVGIFGEACTQKTKLVNELAEAFAGVRGTEVILLKIDSSYEDVAEAQNENYYTFASYFDSGSEVHVRTARLAFEFAKRQAELGADAVLIIDAANSLAEAFNSDGKHISLQLEVSTLEELKKYFAAAHDTKEGGSITLVVSVDSEEGDSFNESLCASLKKLCNTRITFSANARQSRVYPNLDLSNTYSVNEDKLLSEHEAQAAEKLRESCSGAELVAEFSKTATNAEIIEKYKG